MKKFTAGTYINQGYCKAFIPNTICRQWQIEDMEVIKLLTESARLLGKLDMYSKYVHIELYVSMHVAKEATQSSRIEGTQTNMEEAFMEKRDITSEKRSDWTELQNYIEAMNDAVRQLPSLPFSSRLIKQTHRLLLQGVRGAHKLPGEYRTSQNWIGGATINDALFVPPPHTEIGALLSDLEKFANDEQLLIPDLLKIALIHYQFETIHPFLDGNGRIGRLMITLYLVDKGLLTRPILYLSDFFEQHRDLYYENLMAVRQKNDIDQWCKFFLTGIMETAQKGIATFDALLQLQKTTDKRIGTLGSRSVDAQKIVMQLYRKPVINVKRVAEVIGKSTVSAYKLIEALEKLGILQEFTGGNWRRNYIFREYMDLFSSRR